MQKLITEHGLRGSVDLVYIDPPFATNTTFSVSAGRGSTISRARDGEIAYADTLTGPEFLSFLRERLVLLHALLSDCGSIYLHIDYKVGHYVKVLMDEVFGQENFRNDITRIKCNPKNFARRAYGNMKDMILFYSKGPQPIRNDPRDPFADGDIVRLYPKIDGDGRRYTTIPLHAPGETREGDTSQPFKGLNPPTGRHWRTGVKTLEEWDRQGLIEWSRNGVPRKRKYAEEQDGKRMQDVWTFKDPQYPSYPTEKSALLLDHIVRASSAPDSIVLDCFCGSGTTLEAAALNGRRYIGIDQSSVAIETATKRLNSTGAKVDLVKLCGK